MQERNDKHSALITLIALVAILSAAAQAQSAEREDYGTASEDLTGLFVGVNAGFGENFSMWTEGDRSISQEGEMGGMGALRVGYALSPRFALSIEGYGWGNSDGDDEDEYGIGTGLIVATWHPVGHGFFVRGGLGAGWGEFLHPDTGLKTGLGTQWAGLFGLGYDWRIGASTTLGLAVDGFGLDGGDVLAGEDNGVGTGTFSIQFNWHL